MDNSLCVGLLGDSSPVLSLSAVARLMDFTINVALQTTTDGREMGKAQVKTPQSSLLLLSSIHCYWISVVRPLKFFY